MMGLQRLNQTKASSANPTPLSEAAVKLPEHPVLRLQATHGNRAVNQAIATHQQRTFGNSNHALSYSPIQAKVPFRGLFHELGDEASELNEQLLKPKDAGKKMLPEVRAKMEASFKADFSDVRIHEGPEAEAIGAIAYTQGSHIHSTPGQLNPNTLAGQQLLGHELAHVVQQRSGQVAIPQAARLPLNTDSQLEAEADRLGAKAARGESANVSGTNSVNGSNRESSPKPIQRVKTHKLIKKAFGIGREERMKKLAADIRNSAQKLVRMQQLHSGTNQQIAQLKKHIIETLLDMEKLWDEVNNDPDAKQLPKPIAFIAQALSTSPELLQAIKLILKAGQELTWQTEYDNAEGDIKAALNQVKVPKSQSSSIARPGSNQTAVSNSDEMSAIEDAKDSSSQDILSMAEERNDVISASEDSEGSLSEEENKPPSNVIDPFAPSILSERSSVVAPPSVTANSNSVPAHFLKRRLEKQQALEKQNQRIEAEKREREIFKKMSPEEYQQRLWELAEKKKAKQS